MNVPQGDTYYFLFTTRAFATGIPTVLAGTPVLTVYEEANLTQITAGVSITADYDSVVGLNQAAVVATSGNGYEVGKYYSVIISTGTVSSVSVVGEVVGHFRCMAAEGVAGVPDVNTTHVGDTVQTAGDIKAETALILADTAEIGTAGAGLTNLGASGNDWNTVVPDAAGTAPTAAEIETEVWDALQSAHVIANSMGAMATEIALIPTTPMRGTDSAATSAKQDTMETTLNAAATAAALATAQSDLDIITDTDGVILGAAGVDLVWDEVLSGATHNVTSSAGRRLRTLQTGGAYEGGAIWVDTIDGTAGTVDDENGVVGLPVDTWADALTLSASLGLKNFHIANGSTVTLTAASANYFIYGHEWTLALGSQSVASTMIIDAAVSGIGTGAEAEFEDCIIGTMTIPPSQYYNCSFTGTQTLVSVGDYRYVNCQSGVAGSGSPTFALGTGNITAEFRRWSGGISFTGIGTGDTITISGEMGTIDLGSATAGTVEVRGTYKAIANGSSGVTVNLDGAILGADVAAIKVPTDKMTFDVTNRLDVNTRAINSAVVVGDGNATPWDGA